MNPIMEQDQIISTEDNPICCVCLDTNTTNTEKIRKWNCNHTFHAACIANWNVSCPMCRTQHRLTRHPGSNPVTVTWTLSRNPACIIDIETMKQSFIRVPDQYIPMYKNTWKDRDCILHNHTMLYVRTYGVLGICEDCNTIQPYNCIHPSNSNDE